MRISRNPFLHALALARSATSNFPADTNRKRVSARHSSFRLGSLISLSLLVSHSAQAAIFLWDGGGGDNNWSTINNWNPNGAPPTASSANDIQFGGGTRLAPNMEASYNINSLTFNNGSGAFVLTNTGGTTLTIQGGGIVNNENSLETINISNITLGAAQTWSATAGALTVSSAVDNNGNLLTISATNATILSGAIIGGGGLTKNGNSTLTLSGASANTYSGLTTVNAGTLTLSKTAGVTSIAGDLTIGDGSGTDTVTLTTADQIADTSAVTINAGGVLGLGTVSDTIGSLTMTAGSVTGSTGTLTLGGNVIGNANATSATITSLLNLGGTTRTFTIADGAAATDMSISGNVSNGGLTKAGAGNLLLSGTNTYSGATQIDAGSLTVSGGNGVGDSSAVTLADVSGAALNLSSNETIGSLAGGGVSGGNVVLNGNTLSAGGNGTSTAFAGIISGTGGVTKLGAGTLTLSAANGYTGLTTVSTGTLAYGVSNALSSGAVTVNGAILDIGTFSDTVGAVTLTSGSIDGTTGVLTGTSYALNGTVNTSVSAILGGAAALTKSNAGAATLSGVNTYTGITTISGGTLSVATIGNGGVAGNLGAAAVAAANLVIGNGTLQYTGATASTNRAFTITAAQTATFDITANDLTISGASAVSTGALTKIGAGTLILSGANGYTGLTTVSNGTLAYGVSNALSSGGVTINGGILDIATFSDTVGAVTLTSGSIDGTSGVLTGASYALNGTINTSASAILGGSGTLTKTGAGTATLSGVNTYTGITTISGGTLSVATIGNGGVAGNLGAAAVAAANLVIGNGTLQYTGATASTNRAFTITAGQTATFDITANDLTVSGASAVTTGALTKIGAGSLILSGANGYTGLTTVTDGTLAYGVTNALSSGAVTVNGGILDIKTFSDTVGAVTLTSGSINGTTGVLTGASYALNGTVNTSVSAILGGAVALTKSNAGTATLSGANTYTGLTTVSGGTLAYGVNNALSSGAVTVNGGILDIGTFSDSVGAVTLTSGSIDGTTGVLTGTSYTLNGTVNTSVSAILGGAVALSKSNAGTATLSGANTYTGITTISGGTLSVATIGNGGVAGNLGAAAVAAANLVIGNGTLQYTGATASTNRAFTITAGQTATFDITTNDLTVSGASAVTTGALTKIGTGSLILSGANGHTGLTTVTNGTLAYGVNNALSTGGVTVNGGTLDVSTFTDTVGAVTLSSGSIIGTSGVLTGSSYALTNTGSVSAILAGAAANLTKTGAGTATISGNNTYTGVTSVDVGTLRATTSANALGTGAATLDMGGGILELANDSGLAFNRNTTLSATSTIQSDRLTSGPGVTHTLGSLALPNAVVTLNITAGSNVASGTAGLTFGAVTSAATVGPVIAPAAGTLVTFASYDNAGNNRTLEVNGAGDLTVTGTVNTGNRPVLKSGTGTLTLTGAVTSTATEATAGNEWDVSGGVLRLNNASALPTTAGLALRGGVIGLDAYGNFTRALSTTGTANTITWTGSGGSGSGGFAAYTADRNVNLGGSGATVTWNTGGFVPTGSALILGAADADKTVTFQNPIALASAARTVQVDNGSAAVDAILSGVISGTGASGLTKTGAGTLALTNANTYAGATTVTTGTLFANNAPLSSATGTGAVSVGASGTLGGSGTITPTGGNGISVSGVLAPGASVGTIGNLTLDLGSTSGTVAMITGASFQYDLGVAGIDINTVGTSDLLTLAGAAANNFAFTGNSIDFLGTGGNGYYKIFDTSFDATTWSGLTIDGTGLITAGLSVSNLTSGLSGNLIMGGNLLGGTAGDIYLQVIPEPSAALLAGIGSLLLLRRRRVA